MSTRKEKILKLKKQKEVELNIFKNKFRYTKSTGRRPPSEFRVCRRCKRILGFKNFRKYTKENIASYPGRGWTDINGDIRLARCRFCDRTRIRKIKCIRDWN